jgi:hypothetical protein
VSAPLTLPPSAALDVVSIPPTSEFAPPLSSSRTSPLINSPPVGALTPGLLSLKEWAITQWPTLAIGGAALLIGSVALWLMFSGGGSESGHAGSLDGVIVRDAGAAATRASGTDAGGTRDDGARRPGAQQDAGTSAADGGAGARRVEHGGPAAHAESPGLLSIQARPSATAILDGRKLGETPIYRRRTPAGWHTIELRAAGRPPFRRRIYVQPNRELKRTFELPAAAKGKGN